MSRASIIQKVKKLLSHSESAAQIGSEREALAFRMRAESLRRKHKVTQQEILDINAREIITAQLPISDLRRRSWVGDAPEWWVFNLAGLVRHLINVDASLNIDEERRRVISIHLRGQRDEVEKAVAMYEEIWQKSWEDWEQITDPGKQFLSSWSTTTTSNWIGWSNFAPNQLSKSESFRLGYLQAIARGDVNLKSDPRKELDMELRGDELVIFIPPPVIQQAIAEVGVAPPPPQTPPIEELPDWLAPQGHPDPIFTAKGVNAARCHSPNKDGSGA